MSTTMKRITKLTTCLFVFFLAACGAVIDPARPEARHSRSIY